MIKHFELAVYGNQADGPVIYSASGEGEEYLDYQSISVSGFKGSACISLVDCWNYILEHQPKRHKSTVTSYETFVKFGHAMQQKNDFEICFWLKY